MRLMLDTRLLIWALSGDRRLGVAAEAIRARGNQVLFSAVNIWEIAIKARLVRAGFGAMPLEIQREAEAVDFVALPVWADAAARVAELPRHHGDPFDRLLVAQAMSEGVLFYAADRALVPYSGLVTLIDP